MTYDPESVTAKILDAALVDLRAEVERVLAGCGASTEEKERVRKAWAPVQALVRGTVTVSIPSAEEIEAARLRLPRLRVVRDSTAERYAAADDKPLESA